MGHFENPLKSTALISHVSCKPPLKKYIAILYFMAHVWRKGAEAENCTSFKSNIHCFQHINHLFYHHWIHTQIIYRHLSPHRCSNSVFCQRDYEYTFNLSQAHKLLSIEPAHFTTMSQTHNSFNPKPGQWFLYSNPTNSLFFHRKITLILKQNKIQSIFYTKYIHAISNPSVQLLQCSTEIKVSVSTSR